MTKVNNLIQNDHMDNLILNKTNYSTVIHKWKVLIVDDDVDVHRITKLAMLGVNYKGLEIELISAYSGKEACEIMSNTPDVALVLLDVVMETESAGLHVANYLRNELNNHLVRIVLRTGQPGQIPEDEILDQYDIDDYKDKTDLTTKKLRTLIRSNLHSYIDKREIYSTTQNILKINEISHNLVSYTELKDAASFVYDYVYYNIYGKKPTYSMYTNHIISFVSIDENLTQLTDLFSGNTIAEKELSSPIIKESLKNRKSIFTKDDMVLFCSSEFHGLVLYFELPQDNELTFNSHLSDLLTETLSNHYRNLYLNDLLNRNQREIMYRICEIVETRSKESGVHVKRVSAYCELLAKLIGQPDKDVELLKKAAPLHDLGKIAIPDNILHKPAKLDEYEWEVMKTHAQIGYEMLKDSEIELFNVAAEVAFYHHEKWNGKGYPNGLSGESIPLNGRITAIADVFDALASDRCYKKKWPLDKIYKLFQEERGQHFDPILTDLFLEHFDEFVAIQNNLDTEE